VRTADAVDVLGRVDAPELRVPLLGDDGPLSEREPLHGVEGRAGAAIEAAVGDVDDHGFLLADSLNTSTIVEIPDTPCQEAQCELPAKLRVVD
jgi:hypothetical protein